MSKIEMAPSSARHYDASELLNATKVRSATHPGEVEPADLLIGVPRQIAAMLKQ
ncbi:MAG: hypothetical protein NTY41_04180 [Proteobacteria bacterium]|nr:hypothetical protein [Pseudomonadota bacterium]